jgi:isopentenyldiphosphate isomerase
LDVVFNALERILLSVEFRVMISHNLQRCFEVWVMDQRVNLLVSRRGTPDRQRSGVYRQHLHALR